MASKVFGISINRNGAEWLNRSEMELFDFKPQQKLDTFKALRTKGVIVVNPTDDKLIRPTECFYEEWLEDMKDPHMQ